MSKYKSVIVMITVPSYTSDQQGQSVSRSVGQSVCRSVGPSVRRSVGPSVSQSVDFYINFMKNWLQGHVIMQLAACCIMTC